MVPTTRPIASAGPRSTPRGLADNVVRGVTSRLNRCSLTVNKMVQLSSRRSDMENAVRGTDSSFR